MANIATRLFKNVEFLIITMKSDLESQLTDSVLGNTNLPIKVSGEVRLSDGYGEHYILLETEAQFSERTTQSEPEPTDEVTLGELAKKLHDIYEPNCIECSYTEQDWEAVKKVILPIIESQAAKLKAKEEKILMLAAENIRLHEAMKG